MKLNKELLRGGFVLLIAFGVFNLLNFIFQLSMARMLSIIDYGIFATLFSLIYIGAVFTESVQTIITKYSSRENKKGKLKNILKKSLRKSFLIASALFLFFLFLSVLLSRFLEIDYLLLAITGFFIFSVFLSPVTRGIMQGRRKFFALGTNMVLEAVLKLSFAFIFVYFGWRVYGAIIGSLMGFLIGFILSFLPLREITKKTEEKSDTIGIYNYAKPTFFITLIIVAFYSIDIIIAKIVFSKEIAGAYAIASVLSKAIFWGTQPISKAMFPLASEKLKDKSKNANIFLNALIFVFILITIALVAFYLFPGLIIFIFSGKFVYESIGILFYLGIGTSLISLANLVLLYKLSVNKTSSYKYLFIFLILEIFLLFHFSATVLQFSIAFITASAIFLWGTITFFR